MVSDAAKVDGTAAIQTRYRLVETIYRDEIILTQADLGVGSESWLWKGVSRLAREAALKPLHKQGAMLLAKGLKLGVKSHGWLEVARLPGSALRREALLRALLALENALEAELPRPNACRVSERVRSFTIESLRTIDPDLRRAVKTGFKPRLTLSKPKPRPLISSLAGSSSDGTPRPLIEAIPHHSLQNLRDKRKATLVEDMRNIEAACQRELEEHLNYCKIFESIRRFKVPKNIRRILNDAIVRATKSAADTRIETFERLGCKGIHLATLYWEAAEDAAADSPNAIRPLRMRNPGWIADSLQREASITGLPRDPFAHYFYGDSHCRSACMVGLCAHTGWNSDAIYALRNSSILGDVPPYTIQSFKGKTGRDTPVSVVEKSDTLALLCIEFLRRRLYWLKAFGLVKPTETRLWLNPGRYSDPNRELRQYVGVRQELKKFEEKHSLPRFSPDQIRNQFIGIADVYEVDLGFIQDVAGHESPDTTAGYLQQDLLRSLNQAINFEFQKRLEASVEYEGELKSKGTKRDFGRSLLYPIGDGSSCADLERPPEPSYLVAGVCQGGHCHDGDSGCPNRKIVLNALRVAENVHQLNFYKLHWQALLDSYPESFRKYHLPAMMFSVMLDKVIAAGPLASVQNDEKARLAAKGAKHA